LASGTSGFKPRAFCEKIFFLFSRADGRDVVDIALGIVELVTRAI
jgi:hypothetical protein